MSLPLPPLEEQKHIVAKVDQFMTLCDQLEARLKNAQEEGKTQLAAVVVSILRLMLMNSVQAKLEASRQELLDLGLRNKLISYRPLKTRGVEIVDELPEHVYQILVQADRAMYFLPKPSPETENDKDIAEQMDWFALPEDDEERDFDRHIDYRLQTGYSLAELQRRLLNTYYTARTYIEEQGVNTLYLALGMLQWYESPSSEIQRQAPLVLVPVELKRTSVRARFHVRYTGEDLGTNLSLQARVESDFSVRLPSLPEDDELDLPHYFQEVDFAVLRLPRWSVDTSAITLGFFSFSKFLMYRDLDAKNWPEEASPNQHSILQSVLGTGFQEPDSVIGDDDHIDQHINPAQTHHVVDADSSQTLAICDVSQGRNLVIQGPPGTGKSQTITNLIAEAIGKRKRVLFVAEKMAALEVVKRNLDRVGLGDACLELHSHKMNKRAVIDELKRTLELGQPKVTAFAQELEILVNSRDRLNRYCDAVNMPIGESDITPYQAFGTLLTVARRLSGVELPTLNLHQFQHSAAEFRQGLAITEELQTLLKRMGTPIAHPFWGSQCKIFLPNDSAQLEQFAEEARGGVLALKNSSAQLAQQLKLPAPDTLEAIERIIYAARRALEAPELEGVAVKATEWLMQSEDLEAGLHAGERLTLLHKAYDEVLIPEAWGQNVLEVRKVLAVYGPKWWRILSGKYRRARNELAGLCAQPLPKSLEAQFRIVNAILEVQREQPRLEKIGNLGKRLFGTHWQGESSNWANLQAITQYMKVLHQSIETTELSEELIDFLASNPDLETLRTSVSAVEEYRNVQQRAIQTLIEKIQLDETMRFGEDGGLVDCSLEKQAQILERWQGESDKLQDIVSYNHLAEALIQNGFAEIVKVGSKWTEASQFLSKLLQRAWYSALIEKAMQQRPVLASFDSDTHQHVAEKFRELDALSLQCSRAQVALKHWTQLPKQGASGGQLGVLMNQFSKKRRHLPIRQLMLQAGNAIQAIKPIFMMSPLSVATFLPPDSVHFDWVIFDEASQVKPVDAFGAIIRGTQAIVVGDSRQLPPSRFFDKTAEDDEDDAESTTSDMESVLGLFCAQNAPQRMLRWHYRSRHESLIAVSNYEFYDNKLELFPSPDAAKEEVGLVYHYLPDTTYDRGKSGRNREEARIVVEAVMEHARSRPDQTLGVATFSMSQMQAIQDRLEILRRENLSYEHFFDAHPEEPFFVKNLENVQGDERDIIFISIGYGRSADGKLTMNFGPLNQDGGERRLNVLITRARRRCEVFTNLKADDLDLSRTNARGVVALKRYLKYAETGDLDIPVPTGREADSPFEEAVANALRELDFSVDHQIGSAGYFIDLAIKDKKRPGRYLLGIECDGATYHSARSARDRDRLRQQVLEGMGWRIHRIWSTDWFRTPDRELRKTVEAIEAAKAHVGAQSILVAKTKDPEAESAVIQRSTPEPQESISTEKYRLTELTISTNGLDLHQVLRSRMADWIKRVVEIESPVHFDEMARRITTAVGVSRIGNRIRDALESAAGHAARSGEIQRRGKFFYWTAQNPVTVRNRRTLSSTSRKLNLIAPEEIEVAIKNVVSNALGMYREHLPQETCKLFGFKSASENMRQQVEKVIDKMIEQGQLSWKGNSLVSG